MFYIIYKITNQIDGKIYVGSHKTNDLNDNYMGSGKYLKYAQEKYGIENFTKEILFVFDTSEEMYAKEAEIVNEEFLATENTYNLKIGGFGGFGYINEMQLNTRWKDALARATKIAKTQKRKWESNEVFSESFKETIGVRSESFIQASKNGTFRGKSHTDETKSKISIKNAELQRGVRNSQYGTRWIHSLELQQSKKVKKDDPLPDGWVEGRKINF